MALVSHYLVSGGRPVFATPALPPADPDRNLERKLPRPEAPPEKALSSHWRNFYGRKLAPVSSTAAAAAARPVLQSNFDRFAAIKHSYIDRFEAIKHLATQVDHKEEHEFSQSPTKIYNRLINLLGDRNVDILIRFIHEHEHYQIPGPEYYQIPDPETNSMVRVPNLILTIFCPEAMSNSLIKKIVISLFSDEIVVKFDLDESKVTMFKEDPRFHRSMLDKYIPYLPTNQPFIALVDQYLQIAGLPDLRGHPFGSPGHHGSDTFLKNCIAEHERLNGREAIKRLYERIEAEARQPNNELVVQKLMSDLELLQSKGFRGSQAHRVELIDQALEGLPNANIPSVSDLIPQLKSVFSGIPKLSFDLNTYRDKMSIKYDGTLIGEMADGCRVIEIDRGQGPIEYVLQRLWIFGAADLYGRLPSNREHVGCPDWILDQKIRIALRRRIV